MPVMWIELDKWPNDVSSPCAMTNAVQTVNMDFLKYTDWSLVLFLKGVLFVLMLRNL
jgi:hypothetical protein